jgi:hypothetical protein
MTQQSAPATWQATRVAPATAQPNAQAHRLLVRALTVVGIAGIALIHLAQLPDTWRESSGLGALFVLLVVVAALVAGALVHADHTLLWQLSAIVALGPIAGYLLTRSISVPFDHHDVGNWLEPAVLVALFIEVSVLALCGYVRVTARANPSQR